jgi:tetratricopeptide (TPR) repeat protein
MTPRQRVSEIYTRIAEELSALPAPEDLDAPQPDYAKAADFYLKALDLELEPSLKMELEFRRARMVQLAGDPRGAVNLFRELLETWDPEWRERNGLGPMAEGMPSLPQKRATLVRYYLATALLDSGDRAGAQNLTREIIDSASGEIAAAALLLNLRSYNFPQPANPNDWALGLRDARMFLDRFPDHLKAVEVAFQIAQADLFISGNQSGGRIEEAIADLKAFLAKSEFSLTDEVPDRPESLLLALHAPQNSPVSSRQRFSELAPNAQFLLGQTYLQIKEYEESKEAFALYLRNYPNGPQWTQAQEGLLNIEFQRGLDQVAEKDYEGAIATWQAFLDAHPLTKRRWRQTNRTKIASRSTRKP